MREWKIAEVNCWLKGWCHQGNFEFLDHGLHYLHEGLLTRDGLHLTRTGKNVFGRHLTQLIQRALNNLQGEGEQSLGPNPKALDTEPDNEEGSGEKGGTLKYKP